MYEAQLCPVQLAEPPPAPPPPVPPAHWPLTHAQVPPAAVQAPSAEPAWVPVRQEPLQKPQLLTAVHALQVAQALHASAEPPPALPVVQSPPWHERPWQQSEDEVQAI